MTATKKKKTAKVAEQPAGFCVYLGPTIRGVITQGQIIPGTRKEAIDLLASAVTKYPTIARLIVTGAELPAARVSIKKPGSLLHISFNKLANGQ